MTTIKASCPADGDVELTSDDITLRVCEPRPSLSHYTFVCPTCSKTVRKDADDHIIRLLSSAQVPVQRVEIPLEVLETKAGATLTYDDLLDFALALQATDVLVPFALRNRGGQGSCSS